MAVVSKTEMQQKNDFITVLGNLAGILAATLSSLIEVCDRQYVKLDSTVLTKDWLKLFMESYAKLYTIEENIETSDNDF